MEAELRPLSTEELIHQLEEQRADRLREMITWLVLTNEVQSVRIY